VGPSPRQLRNVPWLLLRPDLRRGKTARRLWVRRRHRGTAFPIRNWPALAEVLSASSSPRVSAPDSGLDHSAAKLKLHLQNKLHKQHAKHAPLQSDGSDEPGARVNPKAKQSDEIWAEVQAPCPDLSAATHTEIGVAKRLVRQHAPKRSPFARDAPKATFYQRLGHRKM
jgi:hypothetical protein